jgi:hypothetical protein
LIKDPKDEEMITGMKLITEQTLGKERWGDARLPNDAELRATCEESIFL